MVMTYSPDSASRKSKPTQRSFPNINRKEALINFIVWNLPVSMSFFATVINLSSLGVTKILINSENEG